MTIRETVLQWLHRLERSTKERERWREAARIAATLPVSPTRVRELLDGGLDEHQVRMHVAIVIAMGGTP